jgi:hypothetical protein
LRGRRKAHDAAQVIAIGERQRRHPELDGFRHELLGVGSAVEHGEGGVAVQFYEAVHGGDWSVLYTEHIPKIVERQRIDSTHLRR